MLRERLAVQLGLGVLAALLPMPLRGDGGAFPHYRWSDIGVFTGDQQALVVYTGGAETMVVSTRVTSDGATPYAWVLPVPALIRQSDVSVCTAGVLDDLQQLTQPRALVARHGCLGCASDGPAGGPAGDFSSVHDWGTISVDAYTIRVLSASESAQLAQWLRDEGYQVPVEAEPVLDAYVRQSWYFLAVRVGPPATGGHGVELPALVLRFPTAQPVYPMRISGVSSLTNRPAEVLLFTISEHRLAGQNWPTAEFAPENAPSGALLGMWEDWYDTQLTTHLARLRAQYDRAGFVVEWSGPLPSAVSPELAGLTRGVAAPYLTRLRTRITAADMDRDVLLARAPTDQAFQVRVASAELRREGYARGAATAAILAIGVCSTVTAPAGQRRRRALYTLLALLPFL